MDINKKIQEIVAARGKSLPTISAELRRVEDMSAAMKNLETLYSKIKREIEEGKGDYFDILNENPKMLAAFQQLDMTEVNTLLERQIELLRNLYKRFERPTLSIAMVGYERQGKSRFLQSITGLDNKVIPSYSGDSCTGSVSVIHNTDGPFHTDITYFSVEEFLAIVNQKIKSFFPSRNIQITDPQQLKTVDLTGFSSNDASLANDYGKFIESYCSHVDDYCNLLGRGTVKYTDIDEIAQHVAQFEYFDTQVPGSVVQPTNSGETVYLLNYYKYLVVKSVHIYKQFEMIDSKLIELVDTIGIGTASDNTKIEEEMYRVLCEECDAAVTIFKPDPLGGGFNGPQTMVLGQIATRLKDRQPDKWIVYVVNKVSSGVGKNIENLPAIVKRVQTFLEGMTVKPIAWTKIVDGSNSNDVFDNLVNPLLELISVNLPELDGILMSEANENGEKLRDAYFALVSKAGNVLQGSVMQGASEGRLFDELYDRLTLASALRKLDEDKYAANSQKPCKEIERAINEEINNINKTIPSLPQVESMFDKGVKSPSEIYESCCDDMLTNIAKAFDNISNFVITPLREKAKSDVAESLFHAGLFGRIPLKGYDVAQGPSIQWLQCLIDEKIKEGEYPNLRKVLLYLLKYDFTIKYTIEYDVSLSLGMIDKLNLTEFRPLTKIPAGTVNERALAVLTQLINKAPRIKAALGERSNRFALVPSHSFAAMVGKFRTELIRGEQTSKELRNFYRDNAWVIWKNNFMSIQKKEMAFGEWQKIVDELAALYSSNGYTLIPSTYNK